MRVFLSTKCHFFESQKHFERERDKKRSVSRFFFDSNLLLLPFVFFFLSFFSRRRCGKKEKKRKKIVGSIRNDRSASLPSTFSAKKAFSKGLFDFSKKRAKKTLRTHEERDDDDDCIMGAPASETPCTLRGATTGWSSSFDWSRRRPCSMSGECKIFVFSLLRVGSDAKLERIG